MSATARPADLEDLKRLVRALNDQGADYVLIGGYALLALGYQRATTDIDLLLPRSIPNGERVKLALLALPDRAAAGIDPAWFADDEAIRVADEIVVDLLFGSCGETIESLRPHIVTIDLDGVAVRTLDVEGLLKTKQSLRDNDRLDRIILERALEESRRRD